MPCARLCVRFESREGNSSLVATAQLVQSPAAIIVCVLQFLTEEYIASVHKSCPSQACLPCKVLSYAEARLHLRGQSLTT